MTLSKKIHATILILVNFLLLHYIVSSLPIRFDLTETGNYSLSQGSKEVLGKIEDPIDLDFYTSKSLKDLPTGFAAFATRVEKLLQQYERASKGMLRLNIIDPSPDTEEEEAAVAAGLRGVPISANGDSVYLGAVISQGDSQKSIPFFDYNQADHLEYEISKLIHEVQQLAKPRLGIISTIELQAPPMNPMMMMQGQQQQPDQYIYTQLSANFEIESIETSASELPKGLDVLAVIHPQELSDDLLYAIDQFALSGKPVFIAVDPSSFNGRMRSRQMQMMGGGQEDQSSDLPGLFAAWGIEYDASQVAMDLNQALSQGPGPDSKNPTLIALSGASINADLLPASGMDNAVWFLEAGSLKLKEGASAAWTPVLSTTEQGSSVQTMMLQYAQAQQLIRQAASGSETLVVAGLLTGEIQTAFPEGRPAQSPDNEENPAESPEPAAPQLKSGKATLFIAADTDWLLDQFTIQRGNFLGMSTIQPMNDNQALAANFMDYLAGSQDLISIRSKGRVNRNFDVVQAMELEAQKEFQAKLQSIEERLQATSGKLQELISQQQGSGLILATPEMQAVIDEQRAEEAKLKSERRQIRHDLRRGIENLGRVIKTVNLLWAPVALALFGLYFSRMRKRA